MIDSQNKDMMLQKTGYGVMLTADARRSLIYSTGYKHKIWEVLIIES